MTEEEWRVSTDFESLLYEVASKLSSRQLRLLCCAACRHVWSAFDEQNERPQIETIERHAGHLASGQALSNVRQVTQRVSWYDGDTSRLVRLASWAERRHDVLDAFRVAQRILHPLPNRDRHAVFADWELTILDPDSQAKLPPDRAYADMIRDVISNPFRPNPLQLTWLTSNVVALARSIYAEYAFDRLPILADALMDAGCEDERVLEHCRSDGPHVRGCWVVDMLLGKD